YGGSWRRRRFGLGRKLARLVLVRVRQRFAEQVDGDRPVLDRLDATGDDLADSEAVLATGIAGEETRERRDGCIAARLAPLTRRSACRALAVGTRALALLAPTALALAPRGVAARFGACAFFAFGGAAVAFFPRLRGAFARGAFVALRGSACVFARRR